MLAVNYSTIRNHLKDYCDQATDNHETVIVTRKGEKNVVIMSLERYNQLEKAARNAEYLAMCRKHGYPYLLIDSEYKVELDLQQPDRQTSDLMEI